MVISVTIVASRPRERDGMTQKPGVVVTSGSASSTRTDHGDGQVMWVLGVRLPSVSMSHWNWTFWSNELNASE
jgi:hypothetical protein